MIQQLHLVQMDAATNRRRTRRDRFLARMEELLPIEKMKEKLSPYYAARKGRARLYPPERMLRMYLIRLFYGLTDEGTEDICSDSAAMQDFLCMDTLEDSVPDATTLGAFRAMLAECGAEEEIHADLRQAYRVLALDSEWKKTAGRLEQYLDAEEAGKKPHPYV